MRRAKPLTQVRAACFFSSFFFFFLDILVCWDFFPLPALDKESSILTLRHEGDAFHPSGRLPCPIYLPHRGTKLSPPQERLPLSCNLAETGLIPQIGFCLLGSASQLLRSLVCLGWRFPYAAFVMDMLMERKQSSFCRLVCLKSIYHQCHGLSVAARVKGNRLEHVESNGAGCRVPCKLMV